MKKRINVLVLVFVMCISAACIFSAHGFSDDETANLSLDIGTKHGGLSYYVQNNEEITITGCDKDVKSVTVPAKIDGLPVTEIASEAFRDCKSLESVTIPKTVTSIGDYVFLECPKLADVYYSGTERDWGEIEIGTLNDELLGAELHFEFVNTDISGDDVTDARDVEELVSFLSGKNTDGFVGSFDANGDGTTDLSDLNVLMKAIRETMNL